MRRSLVWFALVDPAAHVEDRGCREGVLPNDLNNGF
jgi:hypothetical protein